MTKPITDVELILAENFITTDIPSAIIKSMIARIHKQNEEIKLLRDTLDLINKRRDEKQLVVELANDLVSLWQNPTIQNLSRADRNGAIDSVRKQLIIAVEDE